MTSARQLAANRSNAARSTGPRTRAGKIRAARNALRHGLAVKRADLGSPEIEKITRLMTGKRPDSSVRNYARDAAFAQLDILTVRAVRVALFQSIGADSSFAQKSGRFFSGKRHAYFERKLSERLHQDPQLRRSMTHQAKEIELAPEPFAEAAKALLRLDRYEKRAFGRRARAFRQLDITRPVERE